MSIDSEQDAWQITIREKLKEMGIGYVEKTAAHVWINTKNTYEHKKCYLLKREGKYWIRFQGHGHGGPDIIKEISEAEYVGGRNGTVDIDQLLEKYAERDFDAHDGAVIRVRWKQKGIFEEDESED